MLAKNLLQTYIIDIVIIMQPKMGNLDDTNLFQAASHHAALPTRFGSIYLHSLFHAGCGVHADGASDV